LQRERAKRGLVQRGRWGLVQRERSERRFVQLERRQLVHGNPFRLVQYEEHGWTKRDGRPRVQTTSADSNARAHPYTVAGRRAREPGFGRRAGLRLIPSA
jgi:hypothetical protein